LELSIIKRSLFALCLLSISGCSTPAPESKPEYDEVELVEYETCLSAYMGDGTSSTGLSTRQIMGFALSACEDLRPVKK